MHHISGILKKDIFIGSRDIVDDIEIMQMMGNFCILDWETAVRLHELTSRWRRLRYELCRMFPRIFYPGRIIIRLSAAGDLIIKLWVFLDIQLRFRSITLNVYTKFLTQRNKTPTSSNSFVIHGNNNPHPVSQAFIIYWKFAIFWSLQRVLWNYGQLAPTSFFNLQ